jgi:DNA-binding transcriptional MerR regulator
MRELSIGDVNRLTGRTAEHIRRAEKAGLIPKAERSRGGFRYWDRDDLPAIRAGLGVDLRSAVEQNLLARLLNDPAMPDSLDGILEVLAPMVAEAVEELQGDKAFEQVAEALRGKQATPTLVGR